MTFGKYVKGLRLLQGLSLRAFCRQYKYDPGNYSRLERGLIDPPSGLRLDELVVALLDPLSYATQNDYNLLYDLAFIGKGVVPDYIKNDKALMRKLPVLLRTIHGRKLTHKQLNSLIKQIKGT
ncbi:MAG TPA: XRE family transcriptional regulator [bacterium]|nr:XRE family transcriptional regulator [bacterium]